MLQSSKAGADMQLLPRVCFCFLTLTGLTFGDRSGSPATTVTVIEDDDVILPCSLGTSENIESVLFDWKKEGTVPRKEVFMYDPDSPNIFFRGQDEQFKGRVSHFPGELKQGNASIRITKVRLEDKGNYICIFPRTQPSQKEFTIKLVVEGRLKDRTEENIPGAAPQPSVTNLEETDNWALLQCDVQGAYPKPTVEWWDSDNQTIPSEEPQVSERGDRVYITLKTTVKKTDRYRCVSTQKEIYHHSYKQINVHLNGKTLIVKEGDDATLPCSLKTSESILSKPFRWTKGGPAGQKEVFLYDPGNIDHTGQDRQFKDRVSHFPDELTHGNASISIKNTKLTDTGKYICIFPLLPSERKAEIFLLVDATSGNVVIRATVLSVIFGIIGIVVSV